MTRSSTAGDQGVGARGRAGARRDAGGARGRGLGGLPRAAARARGGDRGRGCSTSEHALTLEPILELALQAGRIRAIYGPPGETAALRLYRKLPRGVALQQSAREVSEALGSLAGPPPRRRHAHRRRARRVHALARDRRGPPLGQARPPGRPDHLGRGLSDGVTPTLLHGLHRPDGPQRARRRRRPRWRSRRSRACSPRVPT